MSIPQGCAIIKKPDTVTKGLEAVLNDVGPDDDGVCRR
jgi:hypothetical protein